MTKLFAAVAAAALLWAAPAQAHPGQIAPGTSARPILSPAEAAPYTPGNYLGWSGPYTAPVRDPWLPGPILATGRPDFVVGAPAGSHPTVQAAVNAAFAAGGTGRRYIKVLPGTYTGTVFIPAGTPPLTLYGAGRRPDDVRLEFTVDATVTPAQWAARVNPSGQYREGDPAWDMYQSCATRTSATAGLCATVVWSQSTDLRLRGLTITNTLLDTVDSGTHQALALRTDADRTQIEQVRLVSRQDTFYANANDPDRIARVLVRDSYIEGDTDFVFGRASALFERTRFHLVSTRKPSGGVIFAPSTAPAYPYGFLVRHCLITADEGYAAAPTGHLGRAWDQGAGATGYVPGVSPNGQLVIRDSYLGAGFDAVAPWAPAATTARPFAARTDAGRDLDDPAYNRLFEYRNTGGR
ncbi:putative acyl-CoA thioester hydrolase [Phytohabitans sp. LJ34]|uniref:putative acyl-CoA thioester hydrolase n=1 Tax=Phytohabitans sp. LJ34 TaxID=3452217 RepID=UPI003F891233